MLWPLSLFFCGLVALRRSLYKHRLIKSWRAPVPVIVVGNISVGGTGKTPVVVALIELLRKAGFKPGVVSRGYRGTTDSEPVLLDNKTAVAIAGDEAVLIQQRTTGPVCVFSKRIEAIKLLLQKKNCDIIIADDGLQHYAMQRDFEISVVDAAKLYGNGFCLPAGPLREPISRLKQVDFVLYNRNQAIDDGASFYLNPDKFISISGMEDHNVDFFAQQAVHAVAGTASPERFFFTLESLHIHVEKHVYADHHAFVEEDFMSFDDSPILMTEKDAVKCKGFGLENAWYLRVNTKLPTHLQTTLMARLSQFNSICKNEKR